MKSDQLKMRLGMLMMAAGASLFAACTTEVHGDKEARSEQNGLSVDEPTPDPSVAMEGAVPGSHAEQAAKSSAVDEVIKPRVPCRRVTAGSIPVFSTPDGSGVLCTFFQGDVFSQFGQISPFGRYVTWCPRGVPPSQGTEAFAQAAGTVDGGC